MDIYWYKQGHVTHAVFATTRAIAAWYVGAKPSLRGSTFLKKDTRSATERESCTVLAHNADTELTRSHESWRANGGSKEYQTKLDSLARKLPATNKPDSEVQPSAS